MPPCLLARCACVVYGWIWIWHVVHVWWVQVRNCTRTQLHARAHHAPPPWSQPPAAERDAAPAPMILYRPRTAK